MRTDNDLLRYISDAESKLRAKQQRVVWSISWISGSFSGAIAAGIMILIFK